MSAFDPKRTLAGLVTTPFRALPRVVRCPVMSLGEAMRRRNKTGGKAAKTQRPKTLKRRDAPKVAGRREPSVDATERIALLTRERDEALQQQTATADVLKVISGSPGDLGPVFNTMLANAVHVCGANFGIMHRYEGGAFCHVAVHNVPPAFAEMRRSNPVIRPSPGTGLGRVERTKKVVHILDLKSEQTYRDRVPATVAMVELAGARTLLVVPMLKDDVLLGTIAIYRQEVRPFTDKQIELVENFSAHAVIAIENTRLLNELQQSLQQQTATADVLKIISSSPGDLQPVFEAMLENATRICEATFGNLLLYEGDAFRLVAMHNAPPAYDESRRRNPLIHPHPRSGLARLVATRQVVHIGDIRVDQGYLEGAPSTVEIADTAGARTGLLVPMLKDNELVGTIIIYRQEVRPFTEKQIGLVQNFAAQAVIAIENTRLLNELREVAPAANRHRRCAEGHQPLDIRLAGSARHADRIGRPTLHGRQGRRFSTGEGLVLAWCKLWLFARSGAARIRTSPAAGPR